ARTVALAGDVRRQRSHRRPRVGIPTLVVRNGQFVNDHGRSIPGGTDNRVLHHSPMSVPR
ncbi:hypothetical protein ACFQ07_30985, partial [Actinomadura adrarensis]